MLKALFLKLMRPLLLGKSACLRAQNHKELAVRFYDAKLLKDEPIIAAASFGVAFIWMQKSANNFTFALRRQKRALLISAALAVIFCIFLSIYGDLFSTICALICLIYAILCALNLSFLKQQINALKILNN